MINLVEAETEYYPGHTMYVVKLTTDKQSVKLKVKRDGSKYSVDAKGLNPRIAEEVCAYVREEYNKMYTLGDY
jgi:hypothetical protein